MPFTVITLTNAPFKLRGDLSRWMQEIATGVYVGNINSKIRELLWNRVITMIKDGQATISYSSKNELGYQFEMFNSSRRSMDYDGLNLVYFLFERDEELLSKSRFSNASKIQKIKINFDMLFINKELRKLKLQTLNNNIKDLMALVKKNKPLLSDYKLSTVVNEYNIRGKVAHRAIQDVYLIKDLLSKVNENM